MPAPSDPTSPAGVPPAAAPSAGEAGVGASRWWPRRYDGVVERWVEARRKAGEPRR